MAPPLFSPPFFLSLELNLGLGVGDGEVRGLSVALPAPSSGYWPFPQGVYDRCEALLRPPFDACHAYVSPLPFTASCTSDLCQ